MKTIKTIKDMKKIIIIMMLVAPLTVMAQKFGHVDTNTLIQSLPEYLQAQKDIQALAEKYEKNLSDEQDKLKLEYDKYSNTKATMSAAEQKAAEERLQDLNTRIQMFYKNSKDDLERQQKEKINAIHDKVKKAVQNVGKAGHYTYIFEIDAALYVGSDSKDLTSEVKSELKKLK